MPDRFVNESCACNNREVVVRFDVGRVVRERPAREGSIRSWRESRSSSVAWLGSTWSHRCDISSVARLPAVTRLDGTLGLAALAAELSYT